MSNRKYKPHIQRLRCSNFILILLYYFHNIKACLCYLQDVFCLLTTVIYLGTFCSCSALYNPRTVSRRSRRDKNVRLPACGEWCQLLVLSFVIFHIVFIFFFIFTCFEMVDTVSFGFCKLLFACYIKFLLRAHVVLCQCDIRLKYSYLDLTISVMQIKFKDNCR